MPSAKKRTSPDGDSASEATTRATKVQKTTNGGKKGAAATKPAMPTAEFKEKARPIHIHATHTPPSIQPKDDSADKTPDAVVDATEAGGATDPTSPEAPTDLGLISSLTLLPSTFSTGSYGWKGSKKVWVELQGSEGEDGKKEKVQVMLTINATVVGSKGSKGAAAEAEGEDAAAEEKDSE